MISFWLCSWSIKAAPTILVQTHLAMRRASQSRRIIIMVLVIDVWCINSRYDEHFLAIVIFSVIFLFSAVL